MNGTIMQFFEWYYDANGSLWNKLKDESKNLSNCGITAVWLPPAYKGLKGYTDKQHDGNVCHIVIEKLQSLKNYYH